MTKVAAVRTWEARARPAAWSRLRCRAALCAVMGSLLLATPALAGPIEDAYAAYQAGEFTKARDIARGAVAADDSINSVVARKVLVLAFQELGELKEAEAELERFGQLELNEADRDWVTTQKAAVAERLDAPVRWLAFHQHQDAPLLPSLQEQRLVPDLLARRSSTVVPTTLDSVFEQVRTARLVIPMRLHALVLARLAGCPMAALSYDPKVEAAAEMARVPWLKLDKLPSVERILNQWQAAADSPADPQIIEEIRTQASDHGRMLEQFLQR